MPPKHLTSYVNAPYEKFLTFHFLQKDFWWKKIALVIPNFSLEQAVNKNKQVIEWIIWAVWNKWRLVLAANALLTSNYWVFQFITCTVLLIENRNTHYFYLKKIQIKQLFGLKACASNKIVMTAWREKWQAYEGYSQPKNKLFKKLMIQ